MTTTKTFSSEITKSDSARRQVHGIVYAPMTLDTDSEFASAAEIAKAAHTFLSAGRVASIDVQHDGQPSGSRVIESYVSKGLDGYPAGAWVMAVQVADAVWPKVEAGELTGFSFAGRGIRLKSALNGTDANELRDLDITAVSLVKRPANRAPFVAKASTDDRLADLIDAVNTLVADVQDARFRKSSADVPAHEASEIRKLEGARRVIIGKLESSWATGDVALEKQCLTRLDDLEMRLIELRGADGWNEFDAMRSRGRTVLDADLRDSALGVKHDPGIAKAASLIDLSSLKF